MPGEPIEAYPRSHAPAFHSDNPYLATRHGAACPVSNSARQLEREEQWSEAAALYPAFWRLTRGAPRRGTSAVLEKQATTLQHCHWPSNALLNPESDKRVQLVERALRPATPKIGQPGSKTRR